MVRDLFRRGLNGSVCGNNEGERFMKSPPNIYVLVSLFLCGICSVRADDSSQPPVAGRPALFSGIVGNVTVEARAVPTTLVVESPLTYTVRLAGPRTLEDLAPPVLSKIPGFEAKWASRFLRARWLPKESAREFDYELRPRTADVKEIPPFPFVFFKPGVAPPERGYQTRFARAIPIRTMPVAPLAIEAVEPHQEPGTRADLHLQLDLDASLLERVQAPWTPPLWLLLFALLSPPALCWYRLRRQTPARAGRPQYHFSRIVQRLSKRLAGISSDSPQLSDRLRSAIEPFRGDLIAGPTEIQEAPLPHEELRQACRAFLYSKPDEELMQTILERARNCRKSGAEQN